MTSYRECFEQAVTAAAAGATVLTTNTRSARAIQAAAEQRLRLSCAAWLTPDVLPYGAFVERLYSDAVVVGAVTVHSLQHEQELQLWRQIIEHSPSGREMLLPESAAALASQAFRTAIEHEIALDSPQMSASSDTRAFCGWAAEFSRQLAAHRWTCPALLTRELAPCVSALRLPVEIFVFLAETTPAQQSFLEVLATAGVPISASPGYSAMVGNPVRYEFDGVAEELRTAAQWARQQIEENPEARIGVIFFDLGRNVPQVESAFRSVLHPEQLLGEHTPAAFEIASPLALVDYPVERSALQLLSLFAAPIDFQSFQSTLSSPYLAETPEAMAKFLARVRKHARHEVSIENFAEWLHDSHELPGMRAALEALPKHSAFSSEQPVGYWVDISRRILEAFGWPGRVPLNSEEFQCTNSWRDLLLATSSLELFDWHTDFRRFVGRLTRAAANQNFKPETLNAPIQIMDATESEGSVFDALWIGSCSDDLWPDSPKFSPLIPIALLKEAGVALVGTPQSADRISRMTQRFLQSAPQVSLSLARHTEDEREQRWSPVFASFAIANGRIGLPRMLAERFELARLESIHDSAAPPILQEAAIKGGTSLLQEQSNCPFRAFAIRRLSAKEIEGPNEALAPTVRGKVVELALRLIWEQLKDSEGLCRPDLAAIVEAAVEEAMASELPSSSDPWITRFRKLEIQRTIQVLAEWLTLESTRKPFHVVGHQLSVEMNLGGLNLHGRLDRLDEVDDAHVVIDYKTGVANGVSAWQTPRPRMPQLPFYALAILQQKFNLAGVSFGIVRKGECGFKAYLHDKDMLPCADASKRSFENVTFDEYTGRWATELERIAASFVQGDAAVDPKIPPGKSGSPCEHCHLTALCRIREVADEESDCESERGNDE